MAVGMFAIILLPFVFTLLVILLAKAPKVAAGVIVAILVAVLAGLVFLSPVHRRVAYEQPTGLRQFTESYRGAEPVTESYSIADRESRSVASPIWSEGVESEYEADVYPSDLAAARALGRRMAQPIRKVAADPDPNAMIEVILFQEGNDHGLVTQFGRAMAKELPGVQYSIEADLRNIEPGEISLTFRFDEKRQVINYSGEDSRVVDLTVSSPVESGRIVATAFTEGKRTSAEVNFVNKPWVEDFAGFANERPEGQFIVARSWETCTSENEAKEQAIQDACAKLQTIVAQTTAVLPGQTALTVDWAELQEGGFIADQFVQSFDGMAGRLWRQAILIDASAEKLVWLQGRKDVEVHVERITWAHMILSALGVLVVIVITYLFLNMATRGYYVWSLRIAGTVLAIAGIVSIILVLR